MKESSSRHAHLGAHPMSFKQAMRLGHLDHLSAVCPQRVDNLAIWAMCPTSSSKPLSKLARQWCEPLRERARLQDYKFAKTSLFSLPAIRAPIHTHSRERARMNEWREWKNKPFLQFPTQKPRLIQQCPIEILRGNRFTPDLTARALARPPSHDATPRAYPL